jgi:hypothetical protein
MKAKINPVYKEPSYGIFHFKIRNTLVQAIAEIQRA